jgi:hypothetical protein
MKVESLLLLFEMEMALNLTLASPHLTVLHHVISASSASELFTMELLVESTQVLFSNVPSYIGY